jgi:hypothetical protein
VAKIIPASDEARRAFRDSLKTHSQKTAFDALVRLVAAPRGDLGWHHEVGRRITEVIPAEVGRGSGWFDRLSKALGPSPSMLRKAARFVALYPDAAGLRPLEAMGVDWTRLELTFAVADEAQRHALLHKALRERWAGQDFRLEVQRRVPSRRGGVGGRPRNRPAPHGPEVTLRELERRSRQWTEFHAGAFSRLTPRDWRAFVRRCAGAEGGRLQELVREAAASLTALAEGCAEAGRRIRDLLRALPE